MNFVTQSYLIYRNSPTVKIEEKENKEEQKFLTR